MKTKVLLFITMLCGLSAIFAQRGTRIAYVDMEYILQNVEEYRTATEQLDAKAQRWKSEIEEKQLLIAQSKADLLAEKVLLTPELIQEREEEIAIQVKELRQYQQDRFGPEGDLLLQKRRLVQPIQDQVFNAIQKIGANKKFDIVFGNSQDVVILYADKRNDISDLVLKDISRTRKISAPKGKAKDNSLQAFEDDALPEEVPVNEAVLERQAKAKEVQDEKAKKAEARRAEQLKLREDRKKAYEARRKKILEEKEAKKKAAAKKKDSV